LSRRGRSTGLHRAVCALGCAAVLAVFPSCRSLDLLGSRLPAAQPEATSGAELLGTGNVRVALLVPRSAAGNSKATAEAFRNAAELALRDFPSAGVQVAVYDTKGTPAGAEAAVALALDEGVEIILGPVFSNEVTAIAPQARQAGKPVVAFSSDAGVAAPGIYLLSFLPSDDVARIVSYSASQGRKSFAALLPLSAYGSVAEASFRSAVASVGGRIVAIETYQTPEDAQAKVARIAAVAPQIDALFMPDTGEALTAIASALASKGVTRDRIKFLGSGQWDDGRVTNSPALVGSWFPAPAKQGFDSFARKYQNAYGAPPPRNATLAYDGTVLAAGLVRQFGAERFQASVLTSPNGFAGLDGVFRFLPGGTTQRQLAVYEVTGSGARMIDAAGRSFAGGT
jgi:ABC-type branched-subunit amino acid transport system substrate-binding protein